MAESMEVLLSYAGCYFLPAAVAVIKVLFTSLSLSDTDVIIVLYFFFWGGGICFVLFLGAATCMYTLSYCFTLF